MEAAQSARTAFTHRTKPFVCECDEWDKKTGGSTFGAAFAASAGPAGPDNTTSDDDDEDPRSAAEVAAEIQTFEQARNYYPLMQVGTVSRARTQYAF